MAARRNENRYSPSEMTRELEEMSSQNGAGSTYQPAYDTRYDSTYDPMWNSRREAQPEPSYGSPLHREYNPNTFESSNRASSQISLGGKSTGYRTSDSMTPHRKSSTGNQRREPNATYDSRDSRDDTRRDKDSDSPYYKKSSSSKEKGSGKHKPAKKDRDGKYDRDESYDYDERYDRNTRHDHDNRYDRGERYSRDRNPYR